MSNVLQQSLSMCHIKLNRPKAAEKEIVNANVMLAELIRR
jgi:hypothetical protein